MKKKLNVIDLFCGAGGLSQGFSKEGFDVLLGADFFESALKTYQKNHYNSKILNKDMKEITGKKIKKIIGDKEVNVIIGGPPCQGFSMAGKRQPNDPRNSLFMEYVRLVRDFHPDFFVMENVRGLLSMTNEKRESVIQIIMGEFKKIRGYKVNLFSINTADYGVPQKRNRVFVIGYKKKYNFNFPKKTHSKGADGSKSWVGLKSILLPKHKVDSKYFYSQRLINGFLRREKKNKKRKMGFGWQFLNLNEPSYTISARYYKDGAEALIKYNNSFKEGSIRKLTPLECAMIQSFPKSFKFCGSDNEVYQQIGNAVPPLMVQKIAKAIKQSFI